MAVQTQPMDGVIDAVRNMQGESDRWRLGDELVTLIPAAHSGFEEVSEALGNSGCAKLSASSLRQYRDAAKAWPKSERIPGISFTAHREAYSSGNTIAEAAALLEGLAKTHGAGNVTTAMIRKSIAASTGRGLAAASKKPSGSGSLLVPLIQGGQAVVAAIPASTDPAELDKLHIGLSTVLAHVEKLQSKAARSSKKSPAAAKAAAPAKKAAAPAVPKAGGKVQSTATGDLRDL